MTAPKSDQLRKAIRAAEEAGQIVYRAIMRPDGEIELHLQANIRVDDFDLKSFARR